jgi:WD40 repeat protein
VVAGDDGNLEVWDVRTGEALSPPPRHHGSEMTAVTAAAVGGRPMVVTGYADGTTAVCQLASSQRAATVIGRRSAPVTALAALGAGFRLVVVTGGADRTGWRCEVAVDDRLRLPARSSRDTQQVSLDCVPSCATLRLSAAGVPMAAFSSGEDVRLWSPHTPITALELQAPVTALAYGNHNTLLIGTERGAVALAVPDPPVSA